MLKLRRDSHSIALSIRAIKATYFGALGAIYLLIPAGFVWMFIEVMKFPPPELWERMVISILALVAFGVAFAVHATRWAAGKDGSSFGDELGRAFHRRAAPGADLIVPEL